MSSLVVITISFVFSYLGSIPPGTINLSVLQLTLDGKRKAALRFAIAAALIEYPYAYVAIKFSDYLSGIDWLQQYFSIITGLVMLILGFLGIINSNKSPKRLSSFNASGFRRGVIISLLNPLAIPFWIGISAWAQSEGILIFDSELDFHFFVIGVSLGTFLLLVTIIGGATKIGSKFQNNPWVKRSPGIAFILMGVFTLIKQISIV